MDYQGYFQVDEENLIGLFELWSPSFNYRTSANPYVFSFSYFIKASSSIPAKQYRLYYRLNGGNWVYVRNYYSSLPYFEDVVAFTTDQLSIFNTAEVKIADPDNIDSIIAYGKIDFSVYSLKEKEVFVGEYDYTQYFEDLVASSENQSTLITNIKNNVQSLSEKVVSNHAMLFVLFLLALTVLVERTLKGVIK